MPFVRRLPIQKGVACKELPHIVTWALETDSSPKMADQLNDVRGIGSTRTFNHINMVSRICETKKKRYKKPNKQTATLYLAENEITDNVVFEQLSKLFNTDVIDGLLRRV